MKKIVTYVAYDDKEFDNEEECRAYEEEALKLIEEVERYYSFLDKDKKRFVYSLSDDVEEHIKWLEHIIEVCEFIRVNKIPSKELHNFICYNTGYCLPKKEVGLYIYDYLGRFSDWIKEEEK